MRRKSRLSLRKHGKRSFPGKTRAKKRCEFWIVIFCNNFVGRSSESRIPWPWKSKRMLHETKKVDHSYLLLIFILYIILLLIMGIIIKLYIILNIFILWPFLKSTYNYSQTDWHIGPWSSQRIPTTWRDIFLQPVSFVQGSNVKDLLRVEAKPESGPPVFLNIIPCCWLGSGSKPCTPGEHQNSW